MESIIPEVSKYGVSGVAVLLVVAMVYIVVKFLNYLQCSEERHIKANTELTKAIQKNTSVTDQTFKYLKMRNGSIEKAIKEASEKK